MPGVFTRHIFRRELVFRRRNLSYRIISISQKSSIVDLRLGFKYVSDLDNSNTGLLKHKLSQTILLFTLNLPSYFLVKTTCYLELRTTQAFVVSYFYPSHDGLMTRPFSY